MDVLIERACGLDVHKKSITACVVTPEGKRLRRLPTLKRQKPSGRGGRPLHHDYCLPSPHAQQGFQRFRR